MPGPFTATIDFGTGAREVYVDVTGHAAILATAMAEAEFMADDTSASPYGHSPDEHIQAKSIIDLTCAIPTAGVGYRIHAVVKPEYIENVTGPFTVRHLWANP